ncbi:MULTISPECIES: hypothetical protein [unclassified Microcoleus]
MTEVWAIALSTNMKFIGIHLGWSSEASGLCCLNWQNNQLQFIECDRPH